MGPRVSPVVVYFLISSKLLLCSFYFELQYPHCYRLQLNLLTNDFILSSNTTNWCSDQAVMHFLGSDNDPYHSDNDPCSDNAITNKRSTYDR